MITLVRRPVFLLAAIVAVPLVLAACGGDDSDDDRMVLTPTSGELSPTVISQDLATGENRVVIGLLDADGFPVADADLSAEFHRVLENNETELVTETELTPVTVERSFTHFHEGGEVHIHEIGELGVYVAYVEFDTAGRWQVFVSGTAADQALERSPFLFEVREEPLAPAVGEPAPQSVQLTLDDVEDITQIDTSPEPNADMHNMTIAEAVTSGRPTVIVFATPAFCASQICGPTKEVVDQMYEEYGDSVNFVHVEPYDVAKARAGECQPLSDCIVPLLTEEWNLQSEPWVFTVDAEGNIAGRFEGVLSAQELEENLQTLLSG